PNPPPRRGRGLETGRPSSHLGPEAEAIHQPLRVIVDSEARLPLTARVLDPEASAKTLVCTTDRAPAERVNALEDAGAEVLALPDPEWTVLGGDALLTGYVN